MDSLTQLTLGAAVGEAVAGKKLGNKAMLWGALAGTIPDLDVISNFWMNDIEAMAFHRGFTHSIFFSVVFPGILALFTTWLYGKKPHASKAYVRFWQKVWIVIGSLMITATGFLVITSFNAFTLQVFVVFGGLGGFWIWRSFKQENSDFEEISYLRWYVLFFLAFATHIMIDAFTTYGTQIFQPFDNLRVTTSNISVVDPLYTVPLFFCLILASFYNRRRKLRWRWNWAGLIISSFYMLLTFINKSHIDSLFENRLNEMGIEAHQSMTNPTIFNNILWHGVAELDTAYVESYYSLFDEKTPFEELRILPKNRHLIESSQCDKSENLDVLRWFSDGFYNFKIEDGQLYYNDLRFGTIWLDELNKPDRQVFYFRIEDNCNAHEIRDTEDMGELFTVLIKRIMGE